MPDVLVLRLPRKVQTPLLFSSLSQRIRRGECTPHASFDFDSEAKLNGEEKKKKRTAWNKGVPVSDDIKAKVSRSMKEKWTDPEYRQAVEGSLRGRKAWNKGISPSEETRRKMSEAKRNHSVSRDTRRKMSEAHKGKTLEPSTCRKVSDKLKGVPKTRDHREKIAASMRKRHAAIRVLNAVESVYDRESNDDESSLPLGNVGKRQGNSAKRQATAQVLGEFKAELREYRALQDELSPWNDAFINRHGRKPSMSDVERTGISWLVTRYKRYVLLRERLFSQTHLLRRKLDNASKADTSGAAVASKQNANRKSLEEMSEQASRFQAAAKYKLDKATQGGTEAVKHEEGHVGDEALKDSNFAALSNINSTSANPRVKAALQKAFEYRKQKAEDTKSAALDAAEKASHKGPEGQSGF
jgi:DNA-directed RNA polymerase subunit F